jgi:uncharacterized membrane protein YbhN (UPF0104 family)
MASSLGDALGRVDVTLVVLALACQGGNLAFRALAWRNVLAAAYPDRRIPVLGVGAAYAAGVALNAFLPARGGEAAKVGLVRLQLPGTSVVTIAAAGSVVLIFDALVGGGLLLGAWGLGALAAPPGLPASLSVLADRPLLTLGVAFPVAAGLGYLGVVRLAPVLRRLRDQVVRGGAVLRTPRRYLRTVVSMQLGAWACRIGAVFFMLGAFGLPASLKLAALVVVLGGLSTLVPATPGGMGAQQLLVVYGLSGVVSAASALSFSIGMQIVVTATNAALGIVAAMVIFRTFRPVAAVRAGLRTARG